MSLNVNNKNKSLLQHFITNNLKSRDALSEQGNGNYIHSNSNNICAVLSKISAFGIRGNTAFMVIIER